jgi:Secretion system C-terminal sorting domain
MKIIKNISLCFLIVISNIYSQNIIEFTNLNNWADSTTKNNYIFQNNELYSTTIDEIFQIFLLDEQYNFIIEGELDNIDGRFGLLIKDSTVYAIGNHSIILIDVSDKKNPQILASYPNSDIVGASLIFENLLIYSHWGGLKIFDIQQSGSLSLFSTLDSGCMTMTAQNNLLYLCGQSTRVFDITNPKTPTYLTSFGLEGKSIEKILAQSDTVYVMNNYPIGMSEDVADLDVYEKSDSSYNLIKTISFNSPMLADFAIKDNLLFVRGMYLDLGVFNKYNHSLLGKISSGNGEGNIYLSENHLFLSEPLFQLDKVRIYDYDFTTSFLDNDYLFHGDALFQNYPNPFNPTTTINYTISKSGNTQIYLYDILGRKINCLLNEFKHEGNHKIIFNASGFPSGVYYYRIISGNFSTTKKMCVLK